MPSEDVLIDKNIASVATGDRTTASPVDFAAGVMEELKAAPDAPALPSMTIDLDCSGNPHAQDASMDDDADSVTACSNVTHQHQMATFPRSKREKVNSTSSTTSTSSNASCLSAASTFSTATVLSQPPGPPVPVHHHVPFVHHQQVAPPQPLVATAPLPPPTVPRLPSVLPRACIFVANLASRLTDQDLLRNVKAHFDKYGTIVNARVDRDRFQRPYVFLQFQHVRDARQAMREARGDVIDGRAIRIEQAKVNRTLIVSEIPGWIREEDILKSVEFYGPVETFDIQPTQNQRGTIGVMTKFFSREDAIEAFHGLRRHQGWQVTWSSTEEPTHPVDPTAVTVRRINPDLVTFDLLQRRFGVHGSIRHFEIAKPLKQRGPNRHAVATIHYERPEDAEDAINLESGTLWFDRIISVELMEVTTPDSSAKSPASATSTTASTTPTAATVAAAHGDEAVVAACVVRPSPSPSQRSKPRPQIHYQPRTQIQHASHMHGAFSHHPHAPHFVPQQPSQPAPSQLHAGQPHGPQPQSPQQPPVSPLSPSYAHHGPPPPQVCQPMQYGPQQGYPYYGQPQGYYYYEPAHGPQPGYVQDASGMIMVAPEYAAHQPVQYYQQPPYVPMY
ncbi:hypothetical protein HK101_008398 [Irineochytrium annulatum]|nr:hypothetical protein HK101_008398 [Irineochytrium annulatum]